jgi:hypothetical protein
VAPHLPVLLLLLLLLLLPEVPAPTAAWLSEI